MTITNEQIKEIVETLPIGFYANTRVAVKMDYTAETSYFMPSTREVFISPKIVKQGLANIKEVDNDTLDRLIRGQVYHELSHAMLTPKTLTITDKINVFEDERIETLLDTYYRNVDFKWMVKTICDFEHLQKPINADDAFYQLVRFRVGNKELLKEVDEIIKKYQKLNWNSEQDLSAVYYWDILFLYSKVCDHFKKHQEEYTEQAFEQNKKASQKMNGSLQADIPESFGEQEQGQNGNGQEEEQDGDEQERGKSADMFDGQELFDKALKEVIDTAFYQSVETLLTAFQKKNSGHGGAVSGYSGVFNPRQVGADDYRYFQRKHSARTSNRYGTFHLNLFIDDSGSFEDNAPLANKIVRTLIDLEKKYSFFSVDFAGCGDGVKHCTDKRTFRIKANSGTALYAEDKETVKDMQRKDALTYNIVLYDGDCLSAFINRYLPFDYSNATLILDSSCRNSAKSVKNAKVVISKEYLQDLKENVLQAIRNALR